MSRSIHKVAVLGSGVMGSGIAAHFANIGLDVLMLDIVPFDLKEEEIPWDMDRMELFETFKNKSKIN